MMDKILSREDSIDDRNIKSALDSSLQREAILNKINRYNLLYDLHSQ